jgi:hypothetical protein
MLAKHHAMTAGEKVSRWPSADRRMEEDSDIIGSISSSEEHGMYIN